MAQGCLIGIRSFWVFLFCLFLEPAMSFSQPGMETRAQTSKEASLLGVMLGHVTYREAKLWIRTDRPCVAKWEIWSLENPEKVISATAELGGKDFYMATLTATLLDPDTRYGSRLLLDGQALLEPNISFSTQPIWQFSDTLPVLRLAMGSCTYVNEPGYDRPGKPYGGEYQIFNSIVKKDPDAMFWLGDNTYLRDPDFSSKSGVYHRYDHTRSIPEMQELLRRVPNYAIWDDHDYGPNDSDRSYPFKDWTLSAFQDFWANPSVGVAGIKGTMSSLSWVDVDIILLDNRWYRTPNKAKTIHPTLLGEAQEEWLIERLLNSKATFKLVMMGGQFLNPAQVWETYANLAPAERERILNRIDQEGISGVVFVTGDRHHSEISQVVLPNGNAVYDLTVSPLTSSAHKPSNEDNSLRIPGSLLTQRNFAILEVSGSKGQRIMDVQFYDSEGQALFDYAIPQPNFKKE